MNISITHNTDGSYSATINGVYYASCDADTLRSAAVWLRENEGHYAADRVAELFLAQAKIIDDGGSAMFPGVYRDGQRMHARIVTLANNFGGTNDVWEIHDGTKRDGTPNIFYAPINRAWKQAAKNYDDMPEFAPARAELHTLPKTGMCVVKVVRTGDPWGSDAKPLCTLATTAMTQRRTTMRQRNRKTYGGH